MQIAYKWAQPGLTPESGACNPELLMLHHHLGMVHNPGAFTGCHDSCSQCCRPLSLPSPPWNLAVPSSLTVSAPPSQADPKLPLVPIHGGLWSLGHLGHGGKTGVFCREKS